MLNHIVGNFSRSGMISSLIQAILWGLRIQKDPSNVMHDLKWIILCLFVFFRQELYLGITAASSYIWLSAWLFVASIILVFMFHRWHVPWKISHSSAGESYTAQDRRSTWKLKPLIFPCRTSHTRMFPQKHSFSYSYLLVGIPIGFKGSAGSLLSAESGVCRDEKKTMKGASKTTKSWFHVEAADYLNRENHTLTLQEKLNAYLISQVSSEMTWAWRC